MKSQFPALASITFFSFSAWSDLNIVALGDRGKGNAEQFQVGQALAIPADCDARSTPSFC